MMILEHDRKCDPEGCIAKHATDLLVTIRLARLPRDNKIDALPLVQILLDARVDPNVPGLLEHSTVAAAELPLVLCALAELEPAPRAPPLRVCSRLAPRLNAERTRSAFLTSKPNPNAGRAERKRHSKWSRRYSQRVPTRHPLCRPRARASGPSP